MSSGPILTGEPHGFQKAGRKAGPALNTALKPTANKGQSSCSNQLEKHLRMRPTQIGGGGVWQSQNTVQGLLGLPLA